MHENISVNNDIRDRVGFLIQEKSMSVQAFADSINSHRGTIYDIIGGRRNKPSSDLLANIVSVYTDVSASWLLTGTGEPFLKPETAQEKLEREFKDHLEKNPVPPPRPVSATVARNNERRRQKAIMANEPVALYGKEVEFSFPEKPNVIPLNVAAAAGGGCYIDTNNQAGEGKLFSFPGITGSNTKYAIHVKGESMQPTLNSGDVVVIEKSETQKPGLIYAVTSTDGVAWIKRFRQETPTHLLFESDNIEHPPLTLLKNEVLECFEVLAKYSTNLNQNNSGEAIPSEWQRRIVRLEQDMRLVQEGI